MSTRPPSPGIRAFLHFHQWLYVSTGGRLGYRLAAGMPSLLLTTTGRKSGRRRTVTLVFAEDRRGEHPPGYVVVASNHGQDDPPAWLLNLEADPSAEVQIRRKVRMCTATILRPGDDDYARLWELANVRYGGRHRNRYERYQAETTRPISVVRLVAV